MKLTTDFIRAAVEGKTADGREITAEQIQQMANSYNQDVYNARIWPEHIRGIMPDGLFKALGDVVQTQADVIKEGALAGKWALYVKIEPHPDLITMVRSGQKVHLSIEMQPIFPTTKGAYLMGLGVTDSPASLGTGIMHFSTRDRKESVFTEPCEYAEMPEMAFVRVGQSPEIMQLFNHFKGELKRVRDERDSLQSQLTQVKADHAQFKTKAEADYAQLKAQKDEEIIELNKQIPAEGFKAKPKFTGEEGRLSAGGWR